MNNPYNLHSWNQQYRQEALREARVRHLIRPAKSSDGAHASGARAACIWSSMLSLLGMTEFVE